MIRNEAFPGNVADRYLRLLGVTARLPTRDALGELVSAQVTTAPFENISKIHYFHSRGLAGIPDIELYLDGIEHRHFGGTCYSNNYHFFRLLVSLGYDARFCGADMNNPDVHTVSIVRVEGREFLVDTGYGAPFLAPMPLDLPGEYVLSFGNERYVLHPRGPQGRSRMDQLRDGVFAHGYCVKPAGRDIREFDAVIAHSFRPDATFLNAVSIARFSPHSSVVLHNFTLALSTIRETVLQELQDRTEMINVIVERFHMPEAIVRDAVNSILRFGSFT
jgi:N-hydroxyarylamine O-acetyltransferase